MQDKQTQNNKPSSDRAAQDVPGSTDALNALDTSDAQGSSDALNALDDSDAQGSSDALNALDASDAQGSSDALNTLDASDAQGSSDALNALDASDAQGSSDAELILPSLSQLYPPLSMSDLVGKYTFGQEDEENRTEGPRPFFPTSSSPPNSNNQPENWTKHPDPSVLTQELALMVSGSPVGVSPELLHSLAPCAQFILALDAGGEQLAAAGLTPDLLLGDFDSINKDTLTSLENKGVSVQKYDAYKNATDVELGIEELYLRGYQRVIATNVLGGRSDHALGSLAALAEAAFHRGMELVAIDEKEACIFVAGGTQDKTFELEFEPVEESTKGTVLAHGDDPRGQVPRVISDDPRDLSPRVVPVSQNRPFVLPLAFPANVSLVSWGGPSTVSLKGTEWELDHHVLSPYSARGVSNILRSSRLNLEVHKNSATVLLFLSY